VIDFPVRYFWMMILFQGKNTNLIICGVLRIEMFFKKCGSSLRKNVDFQMYFLWNSCKNRGFEWFLFYKVEILAKTVLKVPETESKKIEFQRAEQLFLPSLNQQEFWRVHRNWIKHLEFQRAEQTFLPSLNRPGVIKSSWKLLKSSWNWIKNLEFQRAEQLFLPSLNRSESWKAHRNLIKI